MPTMSHPVFMATLALLNKTGQHLDFAPEGLCSRGFSFQRSGLICTVPIISQTMPV